MHMDVVNIANRKRSDIVTFEVTYVDSAPPLPLGDRVCHTQPILRHTLLPRLLDSDFLDHSASTGEKFTDAHY